MWLILISIVYKNGECHAPTIFRNSEAQLGIEITIAWSHSLETKACDRIWQAVWHVQEKTRFLQAVLFWCNSSLTGDFHLKNLLPTTMVKAWPCLLISRAECKARLFTLSICFNKCGSLLPLWCLLIQCHYLVFVLHGDVYPKGRKGNNLCTKRYVSAHQNKLSLERSTTTTRSTFLGEYWVTS